MTWGFGERAVGWLVERPADFAVNHPDPAICGGRPGELRLRPLLVHYNLR